MRSAVATASGCFRSSATLRRPRCMMSQCGSLGIGALTAPARSMRSTSAPMSESIIAVNGPGPMPANSRMRIPFSGPVPMACRLRSAEPQHIAGGYRLSHSASAARSDCSFARDSSYSAPGSESATMPPPVCR